MKLVVGLGNPGKEYNNTRHNIGFHIIEKYVGSKNFIFNKEKFNGLYTEININGEKIIFLKPQSYMNNSGIVIKKYIDYFKISVDDTLIIYDDMDLEIGNYKLKTNSGSAGHNGLKSIEQNLKTKNYKRLKVGISKNNIEKSLYVLGKFSLENQKVIKSIESELFNIIDDFFVLTFEKLMTKYN